MRAFAYWCAAAVTAGMFGVCGCSSDSSDDGGSSGDMAGNGGTSASGGSGGTSASGGHAGTSANGGSGGTSANGGNGGTNANGGNGGTSANGGSSGAGSGTTYASDVCDRKACEDCFKNSDCHTIDNPCNDDAACDPRENVWDACVCAANGDATAAAACDSAFSGMNTDESQPIIDCVKQDCPVCYQAGQATKTNDNGCAVAKDDCSVCAEMNCSDELSACNADTACSEDDEDYGSCVCNAQLGTGTIAACATIDTGITAINSCVQANCATECGF